MKSFLVIYILVTWKLVAYNAGSSTMTHFLSNEEWAIENSFLSSFIEDDQLYLNIPHHLLETPLLFVRYDQNTERKYLQVIWSLYKDKILLKVPMIESTAGNILPLKPKLDLKDNILAIFSLEKKNVEVGVHTINMTNLVLSQAIEWSPGFSENIVSQITQLMDSKDSYDEVIIKTRRGLIMDKSQIAMPVYFAFCALGISMKARRYDYRMGFYNELTTWENFNTTNRIANITRWQLEKKYKEQELSVPLKPITFIMSPEIPKKWRSYVKKGIEEWLTAFESAGFKNAIVVKEVDSLNDWETHSIKNNIIYWGQKNYLRGGENEDYGGTISKIVDLRTGQMLKCDIHLNASSQSLSERYFVRSAPLDKRSHQFPFPDDLMGALFQTLTAHEAGHAFGIMDGNFGEYTYPLEKMQDVQWLESMGYTPSIMNYTRSNNIIQPEDNISPSLLHQKVGPTDLYNIRWAYTEFGEEISPEEEKAALESLVRLQDSIPWYRYNNSQFEVIGPAASNEVVETKNPVRSTVMALKNLKRIIEIIPEACRDQKDNARLERLYDGSLQLWFKQMQYVTYLIGGYDIHYKSINQPGSLYSPISWEIQLEALDFLMVNAFNPPDWLTSPKFKNKTDYSTFPDEVVVYQQLLVMDLLDAARLKRIEKLESIPNHVGSVQKYINSLQSRLFQDLHDNFGFVNRRKQEIQMTYIDKMVGIMSKERLNFDPKTKYFDYTDYSKGILMHHLMLLKKDIEKGMKKNKYSETLGHWQLCLKKLNTVL